MTPAKRSLFHCNGTGYKHLTINDQNPSNNFWAFLSRATSFRERASFSILSCDPKYDASSSLSISGSHGGDTFSDKNASRYSVSSPWNHGFVLISSSPRVREEPIRSPEFLFRSPFISNLAASLTAIPCFFGLGNANVLLQILQFGTDERSTWMSIGREKWTVCY